MDLNKVMIIGRLTRDPESRTTPGGANVTSFSVATNYVYTNQQSGQKVEQVEFHNIVMWRKLADIAAQYLKKGARVYIEGRMQTRSWEAQDGQKKNRTEIVADNMIMLDSRGSSAPGSAPSSAGGYSGSRTAAKNAVVDQPAPAEELPTIQQDSGSDNINVEDIPF